MKALFIVFILLCVIKIIANKGVPRFLWLIGGILYLHDIKVIGPFGIHQILIYAFLLSLLREKGIKRKFISYPLTGISLLLFVIHLLVGLMDERINLVSSINRPIATFSETYLCFFLGYVSLDKFSDMRFFIQKLILLLVPILIWGLITFVLQANPYYDLITLTMSGQVGIWSGLQLRGYRVCSFLSNPIVYGAVMGAMWLVLFIFWNPKSKILKNFVHILFLINILLSNSRTGIVTTVLLAVIYFTFLYNVNLKKLLKVGVICLLLFTVAYSIPPLQRSIDHTYDLYVTGGDNVAGSNMELKETQLYASTVWFLEKPLFGHGFGFFDEELGGYDEGGIAGMEGYVYELLIEQGVIMIIGVCIFVCLFLLYCVEARSYKVLKCLCASLFISLFFFICATGRFGNVFEYYALIIGLVLKLIQMSSVNRQLKTGVFI